MIARLARALGHRCRPPQKPHAAQWRCRCGQRHRAVFVPLEGFSWFRVNLS